MNSSKKLIYIANLRLPTEKAYGIQIAKTCEAFAELGINLTTVAPYRISKIKDDFFDYYSVKRNFNFKKLFSLDFYLSGKLNMFAFGLKNFISAIILSIYAIVRKPDIIYSRDELPLFLLSFFRKNLIYEAHRFSSSRRLFYRKFKNKNFKVVVITNHLKGDFIKMGFRAENVLVAPDGVDLGEFDVDISKEEARSRVGLPLGAKIAMYTGHLFEWKGAAPLLEVARKFQNNLKDVLFVFVGGTDYDIEKFRKKAEGLTNILILGRKPHKNIPFFLKAADVLILPNKKDGGISSFYTSPLKLFEYMASNRPIVASDLPSVREVLNDSNTVFVLPDDVLALAKGIQQAFTDSSRSEQAFLDVQQYTWQKRAKKILDFISS